MECLGVTVCFAIAGLGREAHPSISPDRAKKLPDAIEKMLDGKEAFLAQMQEFARKLNFAQTFATGRVRRADARRRAGLSCVCCTT